MYLIINIYNIIFCIVELENILLCRAPFMYDATFFHLTAEYRSVDVMRHLLLDLPDSLLYKLITSCNTAAQLPVHTAVLNEGDEGVLISLVNYIQNTYSTHGK